MLQPENADIDEIMAAYNKITQKLNLDTAILGGRTSQINYQIALYTEAFNTLISQEARRDYDVRLGQQEKKIINELSQNMEKSREANLQREKAEQREINKTLFSKAKVEIERGDYDGAISMFKELIHSDHKNPVYHSYLGLALKKKGWDGYAQAEFKIALHYNKNDQIALRYYKKSEKPKKKIPVTTKQQFNRNEAEKNGLISRIENIYNRLFKRNLQKL